MSTSTINVQFYSDGVKDTYVLPFVVKSIQGFTAKDTSGVPVVGYTVALGTNSAAVVSPKPPANISFNVICMYDIAVSNTGGGGSGGAGSGDVALYTVTHSKPLPDSLVELYTAKQQGYPGDGTLTTLGLPVIGSSTFKAALVRVPGELHVFFSQNNGGAAYHYALPDGATQWQARTVVGTGNGFQQKGVLTKKGGIFFNSIADSSATSWLLNPAADLLTVQNPSKYPHAYCQPTVLANGFIVQGSSGAGPSPASANKVEYFSEDTGQWADLPDLPIVEYAVISAIGNTLYALYQTSNRMFKLVFGATQWAEIFPAGMDFSTHQGQITMLSNQVKLWLVSHTGLMYSFDPVASAWTQERNRYQAVVNYGACMDEFGTIIVGLGTDSNTQIQVYPTTPDTFFKVVGATASTT